MRDVSVMQEGVRRWNLVWRRHPFLWETNLISTLVASIEGITLGNDEDDWAWTPEEGGKFSVRSSYRVLESLLLLEEGLSALEERVLASLWKSPAPSKVVAFSLTLLIDRIPSQVNLVFWHILDPEVPLTCVLCGQREESSTHLFLHCEVAAKIWRGVLNWLDMFITPQNLYVHFESWNGEATSKRLLKGFRLIWHATIWLIWKERNAKIFKNQFKEVDEIIDEIKVLSWFWVLSRLKIASCLFYEWSWNPRECLKRR